MRDMPRIRLEIEGLGERLQAVIMAHGEEVADAVKQGVQEAAEELDIVAISKEASKTAIEKGIKEAIESYFHYGKGRGEIEALIGSLVAAQGLDS